MNDDYTKRGFETVSVDALDEYRARGIHLQHKQTGAEVYKIHADDEENLFSFVFRTPPADHCGTAHIIEHSVLCGSQNYPLKDPFLVMLKGSTHTFLNALTYPDKTMYPAASTVKTDFINLLRVYGDAVFFPNLEREIFGQEGHRLEFDKQGNLYRTGIVLNEMKGSYSSPESVAGDWILQSIFPDTPYQWNSGGDPQNIPELTYDVFQKFHSYFYHPSNARIFLYGNHDLDEVLTILDEEFLNRFQKQTIDSAIPLQKPWKNPKNVDAFWSSIPGETTDKKSTISMNWLWGPATHPDEVMNAQALSAILLGHGGAPLQKALIDSSIGQDISPLSGLTSNLRQMLFSIALRGTDPDKGKNFQHCVLEVLETCAKGLDKDLVEGALKTMEFRAREIRGSSPYGMRLMGRALRGWLHGRPPLESLEFNRPMTNLRNRLALGYFEDKIRQLFLDNPHRSTLTVSPDPNLQARLDNEEASKLSTLKRSMDPKEHQALIESAKRLAAFQNATDTAEDLARIPFLSRNDLPKKVTTIAIDSGEEDSIRWHRHKAFTNGVSYLELAFDLSGIDARLQPWMTLFGHALADVGLPGRSYDQIARELAIKTGGLNCSLEAHPIHPNAGGGISLRFFVRLKALTAQWKDAMAITFDILKSADFTDHGRIKDLLVELRNEYRSAVVPSGSAFAALRASTKHSKSASWEDLWYGVDQLCFLENLVNGEKGTEDAVNALNAIQNAVIQKNGLLMGLTSDPDSASSILDMSLGMVSNLPQGSPSHEKEPELFRHDFLGESLSTSTAVSFSALSLPAPILGTAEHSRAGLLAHILKTGFLWENIRMKGGAYGAFAFITGLEGTFTFSTYRDPLIVPSLELFRQSLIWAANNLDDETVNLAVIGTVGKELRPLGPGERGSIALKRHMYGITDELRQIRRDVQLGVDTKALRKTAKILLDTWEKRSISIIAGADALDEACRSNPELAGLRITLPS